jgi:hypothetical protein
MNLTSLATNALATTRSTFKGLAEAAVATDDSADTAAKAPVPTPKPAAAKPEVKDVGQADTTATRPKGIRLGAVLDAYA